MRRILSTAIALALSSIAVRGSLQTPSRFSWLIDRDNRAAPGLHQSLPRRHCSSCVAPTLRVHRLPAEQSPRRRTTAWRGKRDTLLRSGFGFLVLFNGRLEAEILKPKAAWQCPTPENPRCQATLTPPLSPLAQREQFPAGTILFLDQEEGGRLLDEKPLTSSPSPKPLLPLPTNPASRPQR